METIGQLAEILDRAIECIAKAIKDVIIDAIGRAWNLLKTTYLNATEFIRRSEKERIHQENNLRNRASWTVNLDTRKKSQVISNKPLITIRKIM